METRGEYLIDQPLPLPRTTSGFNHAASVSVGSASGAGRTVGSAPSGAWFNPSLDRDKAVALLTGKPIGTFLVRASSRPECYALSFAQPDPQGGATTVINHLLIRKLLGPPVRYAMDAGSEERTQAAPKYASLTQLLSSLDYLDQRLVTPIPDFFDEPWYWGDLTADEAMRIVLGHSQNRSGVFLGRYFSRGFAVTVSLSSTDVAHVYFFEPFPPSFAKTPKRKPALSQLRLGQLPVVEPAWKSFSASLSIANIGSDSWKDEFAKYSTKFVLPIPRPSDVNPIPLKLLWACSHGLVELAYQLIMREGTSRTTRTKVGWSPLNEIMRFILSVPTPFSLERGPAGSEMPKLLEFAKMVASDPRIDVSLAAVDEMRPHCYEYEWDDTVIGYSPFSMCLQSYSHFNPELLGLLLSRNSKPDALAMLAMVKNRFFKMYREWVPRISVSVLKPAATQILFSLVETLSYAPPSPPSNKRLDHVSVPEESSVDQDTIQHCVENLGADVNYVFKADLDGKGLQEVTPLVLACRGCSVVVCAYLVDKGTDLSKKLNSPPSFLASAGAGAAGKMPVIDVCDYVIRNPTTGNLLDDAYQPVADYLKMIRKRFHIK